MLLRSDIQIATIVKSLTDVIMPALGPDQKVASEQVGIIISQLNFIAERAPLQASFDLDELARLVRLANALGDLCHPEVLEVAASLEAAAASGGACLAGAGDDPDRVLDSIRDLRSTCSTATTTLFELSASTRNRLAAIVFDYSEQQLLRDRAWLVTQGWEAEPETLPNIETLLASSQDS
jgi:hypothetical protein